jgi:hypothetical protein
MHPEFLAALARAQRDDLVRQREFRNTAKHSRQRRKAAGQASDVRVRTRLGLALVAAGTRLAQDQAGGIELLHK